ncbi:cupin domain-containing protein [Siccirubricoccus sp. KC 17139]|uniref:Cupin domain-containing protein n=1 Tax=Siccirubricoccus soli TaxID=2899147 RepID=A0ABT1D9Y7_9PROT|nr:cupin domain-containing protein [Siccirubricoccus soli]MCO6418060.1 cupin domain-containing protein [Siccirubricoccus soli]MCP2684195.1 cupin domain-containing protein [Siccirubricoccus soli]
MLDVAQAGVTVTAEGEGEVLDVFGAAMVVKQEPALAGLFLGEHRVPPGYVVPPHVHAEDHESFLILEGELTLLSPEGERRARPGDAVALPRGSCHGFRNDGAAPVRFLVAATPGHQALAMFRAFDAAGSSAGPGGLVPAEIIAICAAHGVRVVVG